MGLRDYLFYEEPGITLYCGDALAVLRECPSESVQCCVTSPPYWGLRDYGVVGQVGLESTPEAYVVTLVAVFREVRRMLRNDGTLWLNLGDTYAATRSYQVRDNKHVDVGNTMAASIPPGLKPKDLVGIPWRVAFALQVDGWYLRSDIIWSKPNPMPESVTDRPTKAHEYLFLLAKRERYYYDAEAIKEAATDSNGCLRSKDDRALAMGREPSGNERPERYNTVPRPTSRNRRSVWTIATQPYPEAHFATFPVDLVKPCVLAGSRPGDRVLDPFVGSGTTLYVAKELGRCAVGIELNPAYLPLAVKRIRQEVLPL